jgi:hypothetical protein
VAAAAGAELGVARSATGPGDAAHALMCAVDSDTIFAYHKLRAAAPGLAVHAELLLRDNVAALSPANGIVVPPRLAPAAAGAYMRGDVLYHGARARVPAGGEEGHGHIITRAAADGDAFAPLPEPAGG